MNGNENWKIFENEKIKWNWKETEKFVKKKLNWN